MPLEILTPAEALAALDAAVGLLSCVDPFVLLQVSCLAEAPSTYQAVIWLLTCVTPLMDPEVSDAAEGLPANLTYMMLFVSRAGVLSLQGRHGAPAVPYTPSKHV